jgi:anthranilate phosphoribosyltransferase
VATAGRQSLRVCGADDSAAIIRRVIDGAGGPPRDIVVLNAAAALWTAGVDPSLVTCAERVAETIDRGAAKRLLERWGELSHVT